MEQMRNRTLSSVADPSETLTTFKRKFVEAAHDSRWLHSAFKRYGYGSFCSYLGLSDIKLAKGRFLHDKNEIIQPFIMTNRI